MELTKTTIGGFTMSKTIETLIEKAKRDSIAIKNGRQKQYQQAGLIGVEIVGDLEEQWAVEFNNASLTVELRHWGTILIKYDHVQDQLFKEYLYAESKSDIDGINYFCNYFHIPIHAHFYPSRGQAEFHYDYNDKCFKTV